MRESVRVASYGHACRHPHSYADDKISFPSVYDQQCSVKPSTPPRHGKTLPNKMDGEAGFFERWAEFFPDGVWEDDDQSTDVMALVVLDEVPTKVTT